MTENERTCLDCMFSYQVDYGYSNYPVEGINFYCGLEKHPDGSFDEFYGEDSRLKYAQKCEYFAAGESIVIDVDRENLDEQKMNPAQLILWRKMKDVI